MNHQRGQRVPCLRYLGYEVSRLRMLGYEYYRKAFVNVLRWIVQSVCRCRRVVALLAVSTARVKRLARTQMTLPSLPHIP